MGKLCVGDCVEEYPEGAAIAGLPYRKSLSEAWRLQAVNGQGTFTVEAPRSLCVVSEKMSTKRLI
jgi:hypothetical protein